jgi:DNA polymerase III subunit alpha, Gram-positive type
VIKNKFQLFLEQSKFLSPILNGAVLDKVEVDPKLKKWEFNITLSQVIEPEILLPFIQNIKTYFYISRILKSVDVKVNYLNQDNFIEHATRYFDYAIIELAKEKARFMVLKNFKVKFEQDEYLVEVDKDSTYIADYFNDIKNQLRVYGIKKNIKLDMISELIPTSK